MKRIPIISRIAALAAVIVGAAVAFALPAGADVGVLSPPVAAVQIGSPATIGARGAVVSVPITVLCAPGGSGSLSVEVVQAVKDDIAQGRGFADTGPCTGNFQTVDVVVTAFAHPFRRGTAFASASFIVCDGTGCLFSAHQREIRIDR